MSIVVICYSTSLYNADLNPKMPDGQGIPLHIVPGFILRSRYLFQENLFADWTRFKQEGMMIFFCCSKIFSKLVVFRDTPHLLWFAHAPFPAVRCYCMNPATYDRNPAMRSYGSSELYLHHNQSFGRTWASSASYRFGSRNFGIVRRPTKFLGHTI